MAFTPREDVDVAKAAICEEPVDLFTPDAREVITRACAGYLAPRKLTALELLYNPAHQTAMMNAGTNAMQAVQKAASWQVRGMSVPVSERIKRIWDLVDAVKADISARVEEAAPEPMTPENAGTLLTQGLDEDDEAFEFRTFCSIATGLAEKSGWADKIAAVLTLAGAASGPAPLACVDSVLSELLRPPESMTAVLGEFETAGDAVICLLALVAEAAKAADAPPKGPLATPFYRLLIRAPMSETRAILAGHIVRLVTGPDKMTQKPMGEEIMFVVDLRTALTLDGELIGGDVTQAALERRLSRLLSDQTIDMLMQGTKSPGERVIRAVALHKKVFGEAARDYLEKYVTELMAQPKVEDKLVPEGLSVRLQVKSLGALHRSLITSSLGERAKDRMAHQVEQVQTALLDKTRLLEKLNDGSGSAAERLMRVVDLCREGAFTEGANVDRVRAAAQKLMKRPDFLESYLDGAAQKGERASRLRDLQRKLAEARIV